MIKSNQIQRPQLVLVVDDQEINRDALGVILEDNYEVIYAENGREALDLIWQHVNDLSLLQKAGCDLVQGYYFSRPLPADEFEKLIQREIEIEIERKEET